MKQSDFETIYGLSQEEKDSLIKTLVQDVSFEDEESYFETDEDLHELEDYFENVDDSETLEEVF